MASNMFPGKCVKCGVLVPKEGGERRVAKTGNAKWEVLHVGECPAVAPAPVASKPRDPETAALFAAAPPTPVASVPKATVTLDAHQMAVVNHRKGEAIVAAAAGSGKTTVLVERTAALIESGVAPELVLTLVYNRSAADGLKKRLATRLGDSVANRCKAFTFHSFCYGLLKTWNPGDARLRSDRILGLPEGPRPAALVGALLKELDLQGEWKDWVSAADMVREALIDLDAPNAAVLIASLKCAGSEAVAREVLRFTRAFQAAKLERNCIDFTDMLYIVAMEVREGKTLRSKALAGTFKHVQIDEAQDSNPARWMLALHLASGAESLVSVGDLRQSIYGFTGARPDLFRARIEASPATTVAVPAVMLTLPVNRRSTGAVVAYGNKIAEGRDWNLGGACSAAPGREAGAAVAVWNTSSASEEASQIADDILSRLAQAGNP